MLHLYDINHIKIKALDKYIDYKIESVLSTADKTLSFSYPTYLSSDIVEECYIRNENDEFVVKQIDTNDDWVNVTAVLNIEELEGKAWKNFETVESTIEGSLNLAFAGTGWKVENSSVSKKRTIRMTNTDAWSILQQAIKTYRCEIRLDSINKTVTIAERIGEDKGVYFIDCLNLISLNTQSDSYEFYTKMIALGKTTNVENEDGTVTETTVETIVENHQYSDKIKTIIWKDERYTDEESLAEDAAYKLEEISKPYRSYNCEIKDLARMNIVYKDILSYSIGDTIHLISKNFKDKQRIVKLIEYPDEPEKNSCELGNIKATFEQIQKEQEEAVNTINNITADNGTISESALNNAIRISGGSGGSINVEELNAIKIQVGKLEATVAEINTLYVDKAYVENLVADYATIANLEAALAKIGVLESDYATIQELLAGHITSANIQVKSITGDVLNMDTIFVKDANIIDVSASKITAGTIDTSEVTIQSQNGNIIITDATQQFKDNDGNVRLQLGQDATGNFNFILYDASGKGILIDSAGIKEAAISDGMIKEEMIGDAEIGGTKINWSSFVEEYNKDTNTNAILSSKIMVDGTNQSVSFHLNKLQEQINTIGGLEGDIGGIVETVVSHTTQLDIQQGQINTLIQDTTITKEDGTVTKLKDEYNSTVNTVNSHTQTIASHETLIQNLDNKIGEEVDNLTKDFQEQIDGKIESYSQPDDPSTNWSDDKTKNSHSGDIWYDTVNKIVYRWTGTIWDKLEDADATAAFKLAQNKAKIYTTTPTTPYQIGDLWITSLTTNGIVKTCRKSRTSAESYVESDWIDSLKYTDDSYAKTVESKVNTVQRDLDGTKSTVSSITTTVSELETKIDSHTTEISQLNNEINLRVTETQVNEKIETVKGLTNELQAELSSLSIGGRNYARDYKFQKENIWEKSNSYVEIDTINNYGILNETTGDAFLYQNFKNNEFKVGNIVTIQYEIKCENVSGNYGTSSFLIKTLLSAYDENDSFISELVTFESHESDVGNLNEWTKIISTKPIADKEFSYSRLRLYARNFKGKIYFRNIKLEIGNKVTDLTPAIEDTETYIDDLVVDLQNQIDGKIETWNQNTTPSFTTTEERLNHAGDLWYNPDTNETKRWDGNQWVLQPEAESLAKEKKRIFTKKPDPPYDVDDLWILESDTIHSAGKKGEILTCITSKSKGSSYASSDWIKKITYTDDSYAKTVESKLTQTSTDLTATFTEMHNNGFEQGIVKLNKDGIIVNHSDINSTTQMKADGFFITDSNGEVIAELSNSDQWSQLKVEKVFAKNVENIYEGIANLYVDHSYTGETDGTENKPFKSFADLQKYLELTPMINKDIWIYVTNPGFEITEQFCLHSLKGSGFIQISFDAKCVLRGNGTGINRPVVRLYQIAKRVLITGNRSSITASDGLLILDDTTNGRGMGIYATDITKLELDYLTINCSSNGIRVDNCDLYTYGVDFGKCACDVELRIQSLYYSSADCGSSGIFCKIYSASKGFWGNVSECQRPTGDVLAYNGLFYSLGNATTKNSCRFGSGQSTPTAPPTNQYTQSFNWTSHKTYCYSYSNWNDSECKQGAWSYGLRGGHMFFDLTSIRSFLSGTVLDGNTITLTRANNGGMSGGAKVYINGSSCSSASGTPSYGGQMLLGTLAWGETKTFSLPKAIVSGLKSGTYNSLAVYVNSTASDCYLNITNCSITLKVRK